MSETKYKESIDTYDARIMGCVRELQDLIRNTNKILQERGLSYVTLLARDLYYSFMNLYVILPKSIKYNTSIIGIRKKYRDLQQANYEGLIDDSERTRILLLLDDYINEMQRVLSDIFDRLDEAGLLLKKDWTPEKGEKDRYGADLW